MTSRERLIKTLNHQEADRVPIDFGGTGLTSAMPVVLEKLQNYLGLDHLVDPDFPYFDIRIQKKFNCDIQQIGLRQPKDFQKKYTPSGNSINEWGFSWAETSFAPLKGATPDDIKKYPWPDPNAEGRTKGLKEHVLRLYETTDFAIAANEVFLGPFEAGCLICGYDDWLVKLAIDEEFTNAFLEKWLEVANGFSQNCFEIVGEYIQMLQLGDDIATQKGLFLSPDMYKEKIFPYFKKALDYIKQLTKAKIVLHSCGSSYRLLPQLIEAGVDGINPLQTTAVDMDPVKLKAEFGNSLIFHGGVDLQHILPYGTVEEVREFVKNLIKVMSPGGGFILAACHSLPEDVPPQNIVAMLEAAAEFGSYSK
ncbi:MAG: uroporphyrinogen decarboxylase family protein [Candidatus Firestonebacteria bacterium]